MDFKKNRRVLQGFGLFLLFMGICTLTAKGIYKNGLPRVDAQKPKQSSITHSVEVSGSILQGQEFGICVPEGLKKKIQEKKLELARLEAQWEVSGQETKTAERTAKTALARSQEDYEQAKNMGDLKINRARAALAQAQKEWEACQNSTPPDTVSGSQVSGGDEEKQSRLAQLQEAKVLAGQAVEDAILEKEAALLQAARAVEDAKGQTEKQQKSRQDEVKRLEREMFQEELDELEALLQAQGVVLAECTGQITAIEVKVGERTGDKADLQFQNATQGNVQISDSITYVETLEDGSVEIRMWLQDNSLKIGQKGTLSCKKQSGSYAACISAEALFQTNFGEYYVYIVEKKEGVLGQEYCAKKVRVEVLDSNGKYAAIESSVIHDETYVITSYSKIPKDGEAVRLLQSIE